MKNYDVCKDINPYYFNTYSSLNLELPKFFAAGTSEDEALQQINSLIKNKSYDAAIELCEHHIKNSSEHDSQGFIALQIFALWGQGKIPDAELVSFFDSLEELFTEEMALNFNKASLYVHEKNFDKAVIELEKAHRKDPRHVKTIVLLFWIYYFSQDEKWRTFFGLIKDHKLLIPQIIHQIDVVESIKSGVETPVYAFGDGGDIPALNEKLLEGFAEIEIGRAPDSKNLIFVAAESRYLREYVTTLILSVKEIPPPCFGIHVHLYAPLGSDFETIEFFIEKHPDLNLSYSWEGESFGLNSDTSQYYASMRFCRAYQILKKFQAVKKLIVTDADVILRKNPFAPREVGSEDTIIAFSYEVTPGWDKFAAGFSLFSQTEDSKAALGYLANILLKNFAARQDFWFIDQIAIFDMHRKLGKSNKIACLPMNFFFGQDMQHTDEALLWTYTNDDKAMDNRMNRERQRLVDAYGLPPECNQLIKAKYGIIVANKYDEYITPSLRALGTWCEHEVKCLKFLLAPGDTAVEVGANMGSHTLPLAKMVGTNGRVIALEPQRLMFQIVCASLAINSITNTVVLNVACGESIGSLDIEELDPSRVQNFGAFRPKERGGSVKVDLVTIDSLALEKCKLIKMDIEGMELEALKGAKETLKKFEPVLFFESHGAALKDIIAYLSPLGYEVYDFAETGDPMYLGVTPKHASYAQKLGLSKVAGT